MRQYVRDQKMTKYKSSKSSKFDTPGNNRGV